MTGLAAPRPDATEELTARPARADPGARRRHGHRDPARPARRGRLPRRAVRRLAAATSGQQRPADAHPARDHRAASTASTSRPAPTSSRPTPSTPTRSRWPTTAWRSSLRAQPEAAPARPRRPPTRSPTDRTGRGTSPARSARPPAPRRSRPDVNDPGARNVSYDELVEAYLEAARGLVDGGADLLLHRDDLRHPQRQGGDLRASRRCSRSTAAAGRSSSPAPSPTRPAAPCPARSPRRSGTPCATSGRSPSASTARSAPRRCGPTSPSCRGSPTRFVSCYPNAGLPNAFGEYDEAPDETAGDPRRVRRGRLRQPRRRLLRHHARRTSPRSPTRGRGQAAPRRRPRSRPPCGCPASSRSPSPRTACSSTSASAPTSPARPGSAT